MLFVNDRGSFLATDIGSLLRANTALTRMMTTYTRRGPGQVKTQNGKREPPLQQLKILFGLDVFENSDWQSSSGNEKKKRGFLVNKQSIYYYYYYY